MVGDDVGFDSSDAVESQQGFGDRLLRRTTTGTGQQKSGTFKRECRVAPKKGRDCSQACSKTWLRFNAPL
jgi:hypothetical protein